MDIDLVGLTEAELIELNRRVIARLRTLREERYRGAITEFRIGERVSFEPEYGREVVGTVVRLNRKTVSVAAVDGGQWRVAPALLRRCSGEGLEGPIEKRQGDLIDLVARQQRDRGKA